MIVKGESAKRSPTTATTIMPEPIMAAWASWLRSMKRPTETARKIGNRAKVAGMIPYQITSRLSWTMR